MGKKNIYWKGFEELNEQSEIVKNLENNEFVEKLPVGNSEGEKNHNRRDFLKYAGFSTAAAALVGCEGPVIKSVPYVVQPEQIIPGVANYYATTIADGYDFSSIIVKTKAGRPIFVKGNKDAQSMNCTNARINASVLSLYDIYRLQGPKVSGENISWKDFNLSVKADLDRLLNENKKVVLLTQSFASPTTGKIISDLTKKYSNIQHVVYDSISNSAALDAFQNSYGKRALADYDFSKAKALVAIDADFLGDWQGGGFSKGYAKNRVPKNGKMSKHYQIEANMSLSGANADVRIPLKPSNQIKALLKIYENLSGENTGVTLENKLESNLKMISDSLVDAGSSGVFITGLDDVNAQLIALKINMLIKSRVLNTSKLNLTRQGDDNKVSNLINDLSNNKVDGLIMAGVNPSYTLAENKKFNEALKSIDFTVSFSMNNNETAKLSKWVAATPHYLESWGDVEIKSGNYSLVQPTIKPLFDTLQFQDVLLKWLGSTNSFYDELKSNWNFFILNGSSWNQALHDGIYLNKKSRKSLNYINKDLSKNLKNLILNIVL